MAVNLSEVGSVVYRQTPRSEAVRAAARERILAAAQKLFVEKGYDATTMKDIVAEAGTSIGNAYFYFGSKEQLVAELVEAVTLAMLKTSERLVEEFPPGPLRLGVLIAARLDSFLTENMPVARLLLATDQRLSTIQIVEDLTIERWIPQLGEMFPGRSPDELPAMAAAIWGVNRALISRMARTKLELDRTSTIEFSMRWTLRALNVPEPDIETIIRTAIDRLPDMRPHLAPR